MTGRPMESSRAPAWLAKPCREDGSMPPSSPLREHELVGQLLPDAVRIPVNPGEQRRGLPRAMRTYRPGGCEPARFAGMLLPGLCPRSGAGAQATLG